MVVLRSGNKAAIRRQPGAVEARGELGFIGKLFQGPFLDDGVNPGNLESSEWSALFLTSAAGCTGSRIWVC